MNGFEAVKEIAKMADGKIKEVGVLPDGSGFATMSMPLPKDHWLTKDQDGFNIPPMPMRMGKNNPIRKVLETALRCAGRYAVRCATMNGKEDDFDPDALIQNLITGFLGYHTEDGLSSDEWCNPPLYNREDGTVPKDIDGLINEGSTSYCSHIIYRGGQMTNDTLNANFIQVIPDSQWFTHLEQIRAYAVNKGDTYLATGIKNSIEKGYKMVNNIIAETDHD